MKKGPDALGTAENEYGCAKTSPRAQNMKTGPEALGTDENEYGREKHDNGTRRPRYRRKRVRERKT
jgi:hypothetical protein